MDQFYINLQGLTDAFYKINHKDFNISQHIQIILSGTLLTLTLLLISVIVFIFFVEISLSPFFSLYFAFGFLIVAWDIHNFNKQKQDQNAFQSKFTLYKYLPHALFFSSICCVLLEKQFIELPYILKVPLYIIMGININFVCLFLLSDGVNIIYGSFQSNINSIPFIDTHLQILILAFTSVLTGIYEGFFFGILNIENKYKKHLDFSYNMIGYIYLPFLIPFGLIMGSFLEIIRIKGPLFQNNIQIIYDPFTEEI